MPSKAISKYFQNYAENEVSALACLLDVILHTSEIRDGFQFEQCIVIPAYAEKIDFIERWVSSSLSKNAFLILVINEHDSSDEKVSVCNRELHTKIKNKGTLLASERNIELFDFSQRKILVVDRYTAEHKLNEKEAVGHARKIGCDLAASLIHLRHIQSPWIYSTDADAHIPENYFTDSDIDNPQYAAQVFNFHHQDTHTDISKATQTYEKSIKYYREALAWAGSPYAFYTLGSTLAIHYEAYAKVRGFPLRSGAEDFYVLNKLAKVGGIFSNRKITVALEPRVSDRVPFGTGPAVRKLLEGNTSTANYDYYNIDCFKSLKKLLDCFVSGLDERNFADKIFQSASTDEALTIIATKLDAPIMVILQTLGFRKFIDHILKQCRDTQAVKTQFHHWFDAFQTLKFIRIAQQHYFPAQPLAKSIQGLQALDAVKSET